MTSNNNENKKNIDIEKNKNKVKPIDIRKDPNRAHSGPSWPLAIFLFILFLIGFYAFSVGFTAGLYYSVFVMRKPILVFLGAVFLLFLVFVLFFVFYETFRHKVTNVHVDRISSIKGSSLLRFY
ncbi:hypothetical protein MHBO_002964 [Bonamia ostreae]|uniref:Uncharacterized protein n=1 Tax=Bonamia ostreae TaxID=126728 RepID=A0ABV2APP8_9EUKA